MFYPSAIAPSVFSGMLTYLMGRSICNGESKYGTISLFLASEISGSYMVDCNAQQISLPFLLSVLVQLLFFILGVSVFCMFHFALSVGAVVLCHNFRNFYFLPILGFIIAGHVSCCSLVFCIVVAKFAAVIVVLPR